jgi:hypothetical protein
MDLPMSRVTYRAIWWCEAEAGPSGAGQADGLDADQVRRKGRGSDEAEYASVATVAQGERRVELVACEHECRDQVERNWPVARRAGRSR